MTQKRSPIGYKLYRFLVTADVHMSNRLPYARPTTEGRTDRLESQLRLWKRIYQTAEKTNCRAVFVLGDLFDKALVDPVTLAQTTKALVAGNWTTYILSGNHDAASESTAQNLIQVYKEIDHANIRYFDVHPIRPQPWIQFWPLPYGPIDEVRERLEVIRPLARKAKAANGGQCQVLVTHNSINGCTHLGWTCDDGLSVKEICAGFDKVFSGHFHTTQRFGKKDCGLYVGAPMHHHFGDVGRDAVFWVVTVQSKEDHMKWRYASVSGGQPRFHLFDDLSAELDGVEVGDYVRYEILATHTDWVAMKPEAKALCDKLEAEGYRAHYKHRPLYHHDKRLAGKGALSTGLNLDKAIGRYVDSAQVRVGDAEPSRLKKVGRNILAEMRGRRGIV